MPGDIGLQPQAGLFIVVGMQRAGLIVTVVVARTRKIVDVAAFTQWLNAAIFISCAHDACSAVSRRQLEILGSGTKYKAGGNHGDDDTEAVCGEGGEGS